MNREDCPAPAPSLIRHPVAFALDSVGPGPLGGVWIRWRDVQSDALHELPLAQPVAWQLAASLVLWLTGGPR